MQNRVNQIKAASLIDRTQGLTLVDKWMNGDGGTTRLLTKQLTAIQASLNDPAVLPWAKDPDVLKMVRELQQPTGIDSCGVRRDRVPVVPHQVHQPRLPSNVFVFDRPRSPDRAAPSPVPPTVRAVLHPDPSGAFPRAHAEPAEPHPSPSSSSSTSCRRSRIHAG